MTDEKRLYVVIDESKKVSWCQGIYDSEAEAIGDAFMALSEKREACSDDNARILPLEYLPRESGYKLQLKSEFEDEDVTMFIFEGYHQVEVEE